MPLRHLTSSERVKLIPLQSLVVFQWMLGLSMAAWEVNEDYETQTLYPPCI
jgi:hypothetical protein